MVIVQRHNQVERLAEALRGELNQIHDDEAERGLYTNYLARLTAASEHRDNIFKALIFVDAIIAFALSGKNIKIPGFDLNMGDVPALMEILVGLASIGVWLATVSVVRWTSYVKIFHMFNERIASNSDADPNLWLLSLSGSDPEMKILQPHIHDRGHDWLDAPRPLKALLIGHSSFIGLFFFGILATHIALVWMGIYNIAEGSGFDVVHCLFFIWVGAAHVLVALTLIAAFKRFQFRMMSPLDDRKADNA